MRIQSRGVLKSVIETRQDREDSERISGAGLLSPDSGPAPAVSTTGCGPLRHTSSARPRSAFLSAPVFSRKPRSLCRKPAKHNTRRGCGAAIVRDSAPEGTEAAFPRAEVQLREGRSQKAGNTLKAGLRASVPTTRRSGEARPKQGGYLRLRSVSRGEWHHLLFSAAAILASHGWRKARRSLLHLSCTLWSGSHFGDVVHPARMHFP